MVTSSSAAIIQAQIFVTLLESRGRWQGFLKTSPFKVQSSKVQRQIRRG